MGNNELSVRNMKLDHPLKTEPVVEENIQMKRVKVFFTWWIVVVLIGLTLGLGIAISLSFFE